MDHTRKNSGRNIERFALRFILELKNGREGDPMIVASAFLILLGAYLACGFIFAIPFCIAGVTKIDPHAAHGHWGFRLLIIPGIMAFWPLLLRRWMGGIKNPPAEVTAHRPPPGKGTAS